MKQRKKSKYVHEGHYVAEVQVSLVENDTGWSPLLVLNTRINWTISGTRFARGIWTRQQGMGGSTNCGRWRTGNNIISADSARAVSIPPSCRYASIN